jgi:hypothetical protein
VPTLVSPHIVDIGPVQSTKVLYISVEGKLTMLLDTLADAVIALLMMLYVFWMEYPAKVQCSLKYLQQSVLKQSVAEDGPVPVKLVRFLQKL